MQKWEATLPSEDYPHIENLLNENRYTVSWNAALLFPVRANSLSNFAKDLFFPTLINHASRVDSIVLRFFAVIAAAALDLLTLPIRLLTAIPTFISINKTPQLPIHKYLVEKGLPKSLAEADSVKVEIFYEKKGEIPLFADSNGATRQELVDRVSLTCYSNFVLVPDHGHVEGAMRITSGSDKKV
jgi:hypothetical protein